MEPLKKKTFYYKDARSDKEYTIEIRSAEGGLFHVHFAFGKRGAVQQTGLKTPKDKPVTLPAAEALFQSLEKERLGKGYAEGASAAPIQYVAELMSDVQAALPPSRVAPMLLNPITPEEAAAYIANDDWLMQPKFDGNRAQLVKKGKSVRAFSRPGLPMSVPAIVIEAALAFPRDFSIDGEMVEGIYVAFDILEDGALDLRHERCEFRSGRVQTLWPTSGPGGILSSPSAPDAESKQMFFDMIRSQGGEGVVFKLKAAPYSSGRPGSGGNALKCKFWATASVILGQRHATKSSFEMLLANGQNIGSLTVSAKDAVETGQIVEVRYLDRGSADGRLKQCNLLRVRTDIDRSDCNEAQLHVKGSRRAS